MNKDKTATEMNELKELLETQLKESLIRGIVIGEKVISSAVLAYVNDPDALNKVKSLCEKTLGVTTEDYMAHIKLINEMFETANNAKPDPILHELLQGIPEVGGSPREAGSDKIVEFKAPQD